MPVHTIHPRALGPRGSARVLCWSLGWQGGEEGQTDRGLPAAAPVRLVLPTDLKRPWGRTGLPLPLRDSLPKTAWPPARHTSVLKAMSESLAPCRAAL